MVMSGVEFSLLSSLSVAGVKSWCCEIPSPRDLARVAVREQCSLPSEMFSDPLTLLGWAFSDSSFKPVMDRVQGTEGARREVEEESG